MSHGKNYQEQGENVTGGDFQWGSSSSSLFVSLASSASIPVHLQFIVNVVIEECNIEPLRDFLPQ